MSDYPRPITVAALFITSTVAPFLLEYIAPTEFESFALFLPDTSTTTSFIYTLGPFLLFVLAGFLYFGLFLGASLAIANRYHLEDVAQFHLIGVSFILPVVIWPTFPNIGLGVLVGCLCGLLFICCRYGLGRLFIRRKTEP